MTADLEPFRVLLCRLGDAIRDGVIAGRSSTEAMSAVAAQVEADTIYAIDKVSEEAVLHWFESHWPTGQPVELIMEGVSEDEPLCFPRGTDPLDTIWKCIIDPIDGTRGLMYDKRSAWALAGLAPQMGTATSLSDLCVSCMTELPTTKQWRADQISAWKGGGLIAEAVHVLDGSRSPLTLKASSSTDFHHGFSSLAKFFPEGRTLTAQIEEQVWDTLIGLGKHASPTVFDDQYISTGGQFYELLAGHDRMVGDIRPLVFQCLDIDSSLVCHPYDAACAMLLQETGIIYEHPLGGFPDAPLDTMSAVTWIAYANPTLAALARPVIQSTLSRMLA